MNQPTFTSTETFQIRAQRSERVRVAMMGAVIAAMLVVALVRRLTGAAVFQNDVLFYSVFGLTAGGVAYQALMYVQLERMLRQNRAWATWRVGLNAAVDLAIPLAAMWLLWRYSPQGEAAALAAPVLLALPLIVLLSVLRLRPRFTLWTGLGAAGAHWALSAVAIADEGVSFASHPELPVYGVVLALTGFAGAGVAAKVKAYVVEAVEEGHAREVATLRVANMERDLSIAREIQAGLMPKEKPATKAYEIAGMSRPAEQTGGDYYDWQALEGGRIAVAMADVTGHGIGPALVMAVCRAYSRATAPMTADPAELLGRLNDLLHEDIKGGRFITLAVAVLHEDGKVQLVSAGHGPTLLYRAATGRVEEFGGDGIPLAIMPEQVYTPTRTLHMEKGDVLLLSTDGFFEYIRTGDREQFGVPRLAEELARSAGQEPEAILKGIDGAVRGFAGGSPQADDMTAVVVKRR